MNGACPLLSSWLATKRCARRSCQDGYIGMTVRDKVPTRRSTEAIRNGRTWNSPPPGTTTWTRSGMDTNDDRGMYTRAQEWMHWGRARDNDARIDVLPVAPRTALFARRSMNGVIFPACSCPMPDRNTGNSSNKGLDYQLLRLRIHGSTESLVA